VIVLCSSSAIRCMSCLRIVERKQFAQTICLPRTPSKYLISRRINLGAAQFLPEVPFGTSLTQLELNTLQAPKPRRCGLRVPVDNASTTFKELGHCAFFDHFAV